MMENKKIVGLLNYAITTEVEAVDLYSKLAKKLPIEYKEKLIHILKEEKEHITELTRLLAYASKQ